jgi:hypothetical protein
MVLCCHFRLASQQLLTRLSFANSECLPRGEETIERIACAAFTAALLLVSEKEKIKCHVLCYRVLLMTHPARMIFCVCQKFPQCLPVPFLSLDRRIKREQRNWLPLPSYKYRALSLPNALIPFSALGQQFLCLVSFPPEAYYDDGDGCLDEINPTFASRWHLTHKEITMWGSWTGVHFSTLFLCLFLLSVPH